MLLTKLKAFKFMRLEYNREHDFLIIILIVLRYYINGVILTSTRFKFDWFRRFEVIIEESGLKNSK